jgi:hypothetical protein
LFPVVPQETVSLFVTDAERAGAAAKRKKLSHKIFMQNEPFGHFLTFFTIYTIFADDLKRWFLNKSADYPSDAITIGAFFGFAIEFVCKVDLAPAAYCNTLPCFLDFASTVSLIMDLSLITEDVMAGGKAKGPKFSRAGRASRVGTKVGRLIKVVRLLR